MAEPSAESAQQIARHLLDIDAVRLAPDDPFTWSSGLRAPIYCDNRLTMGYPDVRRVIRDAFADLLQERAWTGDVVAGTATAGIPHAAWLADYLNRPLAYVRSESKGHGRENRIEGVVEPGQSVVLIEDLISTGQSAYSAAEALEQQGASVAAVLAIFTYEFEAATERFAEANLPLHALTDFSTLVALARERGDLSARQWEAISAWQSDPEAWSAARP